MKGIRWREDTGFEGRCDECSTYWPLEAEFWRLGSGFRRCRACFNDRNRAGERRQYRSPEAIARRRGRDNQAKAAARRDPVRRPRLLARQRETQRRFYERHKDEVLARRRAAYVARVGHDPKPGIGRPRKAA